MTQRHPRVSIVIPVYNEEESLAILHREVAEAVAGYPHEIIFVDDGSTDGSWRVLLQLAETDPTVRLVRFGRNFGKSAALAAGFHESRGDIVITLDADLQDDPRHIPEFIAAIERGCDLVSGWKVVRRDPITKTLPSRVFNAIAVLATGVQPRRHDLNCGFKANRRELVARRDLYGELHPFIPALAYWKGFRIGELPVNHRPRQYGRSKFGARRFLSGLLDLITVLFLTRFNRKPMHLFGSIGLIGFACGLAINGYLTGLKLLAGQSIGERPLLLLGVLLMVMGLQFFGIGLLADLANRDRPGPVHDHRYEVVWPARPRRRVGAAPPRAHRAVPRT
ncbi:MAG: glycosyltransferase family 2 protein [Chloroflexota bacterium]|nr:glycosyltransferase family 2 protein [Chloroflexota bacterium]